MIEETVPSPIEFAETRLNFGGRKLYSWQDDCIAPLELAEFGKPIVSITGLMPNGSGKSAVVLPGAACYWLAVKNGRVGITTNDSKQLNEQIIPALEMQIPQFGGWHRVRSPFYKITTPTGATLIAFTTDEAERVEGLHGSPEHPLMWIVDEAKSVKETIFSGIDRCGYQALMYISTGGLMLGSFYESHFGKTSGRFVKIRAGLKDCPHIPKEKVDRIIEKYGVDNPFTRSSVFGEFMAQSEDDEYCLTLPALINCLNNPPKHRPGLSPLGFCDFGAGKAEHVLAKRDGNKITIEAAWIEANKDATAGRFIREFLKAGFTADKASEQLECDASDKEIWQKLSNAGWVLRRRNFGSPPMRKKEYVSYGAEIWLETAVQVGLCQWILPDDDQTKAQAIDRKKGYTAAGKLSVEDKLDLAKRGVPSPDRWDTVCGVANMTEPVIQKEAWSFGDWQAEEKRSERRGVMASMGARSGF